MSIIQKQNHVVTNMPAEVMFSVTEDVSHLYSMLSKTLYSNKEQAVIQEICANAIDAHQLAGKADVPIKVTGPTPIESSLTIRDYGHGLNDAEVKSLLTTFGRSGQYKRESNDYIGCYGVGAKSPAAVSNNWKLTSFHNGEKRTYLIFIGDNGVPTLTSLPNVEATNETGIEVCIPTHSSKRDVWNKELSVAFMFYPVTPVVNFTLVKKSHVVFENEHFSVTCEDQYLSSCVIVNSRRYVIDLNKIADGIDKTSMLFKMLPFFKTFHVQFKFRSGEVAVDLSREHLQYTKATIAAIVSKMEMIVKDILVRMRAVEALAENDYQYRRLVFSEFRDILNRFGWMTNSYQITKFATLPNSILPLFVNNKFGINTLIDMSVFPLLDNVRKISYIGAGCLRAKTINLTLWRNRNFDPKRIEVDMDRHGIAYMSLVISDAPSILFAPKKRNAAAKLMKAFPDKNIILLEQSEYNQLSSSIDELKCDPDTLPAIVKSPCVKAPKIDSNFYMIYGKKLIKTELDARFIKHTVFVQVDKLTSTLEQLKNVTDVKLLSRCGYIVRFHKKGAIVPEGGLTIGLALNHERNFWTSDMISKFVEFSKFAHLFNHANSLMVIDDSLLSYKNGFMATVQRAYKTRQTTISEFDNHKLPACTLNVIGHYDHFAVVKKDVPNVFGELMDYYPMLRTMSILYGVSEVAIDYINMIDELHELRNSFDRKQKAA